MGPFPVEGVISSAEPSGCITIVVRNSFFSAQATSSDYGGGGH
jgi:hypothetical protein